MGSGRTSAASGSAEGDSATVVVPPQIAFAVSTRPWMKVGGDAAGAGGGAWMVGVVEVVVEVLV